MAWLETDRHGRLGIASKYYDGRTYREPLGVQASKRTRVDAERLSATIQLELSARTFDYAKRFPNSERVKALGSQANRATIRPDTERIRGGRLVAGEAP
jgi:Arm DNA-binding domain